MKFKHSATVVIFTIVILYFTCDQVYAQTFSQAITDEALYKWFFSRLGWGVISGLVLGFVLGFSWLRKLKYQPEELSLNRKVRKTFMWGSILTFIALFVALLIDSYFIYDFGRGISLTLIEAFSQVLMSWQALTILVLAWMTSYAAAVISTRLSPTFSGRYALWPGPKAQ